MLEDIEHKYNSSRTESESELDSTGTTTDNDNDHDNGTESTSYVTAADLTTVIPSGTKRIRHDPGFYSTVSTDNYVIGNDDTDDKTLKRILDMSKAESYLFNESEGDTESDTTEVETVFEFADLSRLTYPQAMNRSDAIKWQEAITKELDSLITQNVGTEVTTSKIPSGIKPLTCRLLFKIKYDANNNPIQWKARLVVQGFKQTYGIDYKETFAPTAKSKSIKLMLSDAAINNKEIRQFDYETAFLNAELTEHDIYIKLPNGCGEQSSKIWKLNKACMV